MNSLSNPKSHIRYTYCPFTKHVNICLLFPLSDYTLKLTYLTTNYKIIFKIIFQRKEEI